MRSLAPWLLLLGFSLSSTSRTPHGRYQTDRTELCVDNAFQYQLLRKLWPEVELNSTFFQNGPNDGRKQNFVTPGLIIGRLRLLGRVGFTIGGGYQIATTHFHTTNHNAILSIRVPF